MKPDAQHIAITLQDGSLAVMQLEENFGRMADDTAIAATIAKTGLPVKSWRRMAANDIAAYRACNAAGLKGALVDDGKALSIDPAKASRLAPQGVPA